MEEEEEGTQNVSIIVTHSNRINELMERLGSNIRNVGNCNIIQLILSRVSDSEFNLIIELIYPSTKARSPNIRMLSKLTVKALFPRCNINIGDTYNFYIVRHGQGYHNVVGSTFANLLRSDPELTAEGIVQAQEAGFFLKQHFGKNLKRLSFKYFVSTLQRSHQTMLYILSSMGIKTTVKVVVLPMSEEISSKLNPGKENTSNCLPPERYKCFHVQEHEELDEDVVVLQIDWNFLEIMNDNIQVSDNMISLAIMYYNTLEVSSGTSTEGGKHLKTRRRRRYKRKCKKRNVSRKNKWYSNQ